MTETLKNRRSEGIAIAFLGLALLSGLTVSPVAWSATTIAGGSNHTLEIRNATLYAWGDNSSGQLGDGSTTSRSTPVTVNLPIVVTPIATAAGITHSLAIGSDGRVYAWGSNSYGALGDGSVTDHTTPVVAALPTGATPIAVAAGHMYSLAIMSNGKLYAWGNNTWGQLGDGTLSSRTIPVSKNLPLGITPTAIYSRDAHSLAIGSDNKLYAWGNNGTGQLGDGTTTGRYSPVVVNLPAGVTSLSAAPGSSHSLAIGSDGKLYAWGSNLSGQLGDGTTTNHAIPAVVHLPSGVVPTAVAAGNDHSLAIGSDGRLYTWGHNAYGELGDGTTTSRSTPVVVNLPLGVTPTAIAAGASHTLVIGSDGQLYAWGANGYKQLGDGTSTNSKLPLVVTVYAPPVTHTSPSGDVPLPAWALWAMGSALLGIGFKNRPARNRNQ
jgi:alpha-tubulin suppressor-like RCC1 family protein